MIINPNAISNGIEKTGFLHCIKYNFGQIKKRLINGFIQHKYWVYLNLCYPCNKNIHEWYFERQWYHRPFQALGDYGFIHWNY